MKKPIDYLVGTEYLTATDINNTGNFKWIRFESALNAIEKAQREVFEDEIKKAMQIELAKQKLKDKYLMDWVKAFWEAIIFILFVIGCLKFFDKILH